MKLISQPINSTARVIEINKKELIEMGFDKIWDEIRTTYSIDEYELESFTENLDGTLFYANLKYKKKLKISDI